MTNLTIYNGANSQEVTLNGLVDATGTAVSAATITALLTRAGSTLAGSSMTFAPVSDAAGNYAAPLNGFDAPAGKASLVVTGSNLGITFNFSIFVTIASRSL
jgi:hypothetical protein